MIIVGGQFEDSETLIFRLMSCPYVGISAPSSHVASVPATIEVCEWLKTRLQIHSHRSMWVAKRSRHKQKIRFRRTRLFLRKQILGVTEPLDGHCAQSLAALWLGACWFNIALLCGDRRGWSV